MTKRGHGLFAGSLDGRKIEIMARKKEANEMIDAALYAEVQSVLESQVGSCNELLCESWVWVLEMGLVGWFRGSVWIFEM